MIIIFRDLDCLVTNDNIIRNPAGYMCFTDRRDRTFLHACHEFANYSLVDENSRFNFSEAYEDAIALGIRFRSNLVIQTLRNRHLDGGIDDDFEYIDQPFGSSSRLVYSIRFDSEFDDDESNIGDIRAPIDVPASIDVQSQSIAGNFCE